MSALNTKGPNKIRKKKNPKLSLNICFLMLSEEFPRDSNTSSNLLRSISSHQCSSHQGFTVVLFFPYSLILVNLYTVDSRYLEFLGTLGNTSRYPYLEISELRK